jgi:hypothetical protein
VHGLRQPVCRKAFSGDHVLLVVFIIFFFYLGRQQMPGIIMVGKLENLFLICNMLYSSNLFFISK